MGYIESLMAENEKIVVRTRKHWMVLAKSVVVNGLFGVAILIAAAVAAIALAPMGTVLGAVISLLLIIPAASFVRDYLDWWNEEYMVTNRRVIQAEGIINKHVIDSSLEKVNDVVLDQSFFGRLFNYGNIEILTASEGGVNNLHHITAPVKFKTEMLNQKENMGMDEHFGGSPVRNGTSQDIPSLIAQLDDLRKQGILTEAEFQEKKTQLLSKM
ncbi:MAG: PH domain-containing protein [Chloroflexi bacterium]|nr:PH domain-containing protein [Chloroflexota bacterium]